MSVSTDYKNGVKTSTENTLVGKACRNVAAGRFLWLFHDRREIDKAMENKQAYGLFLAEERPKAKMIGDDGNLF